jgi:hypothetical protein
MTSNSQTVYCRKPALLSANLGEEIALLDMPHGSYLGFNATAAYIWRLLRDPLALDPICAAMTAEFDVDPDRCRTEVASLLDNLLAAGLITEEHGSLA